MISVEILGIGIAKRRKSSVKGHNTCIGYTVTLYRIYRHPVPDLSEGARTTCLGLGPSIRLTGTLLYEFGALGKAEGDPMLCEYEATEYGGGGLTRMRPHKEASEPSLRAEVDHQTALLVDAHAGGEQGSCRAQHKNARTQW